MGARDWITARVARFLTEPLGHYEQRGRNDLDQLQRVIRKGDVLLVEGDQRVSAIIKYLSQSSWSHAALYVGDELLKRGGPLRERALASFGDDAQHLVVEALLEGVVASPLRKYVDYNVRLCRPHRLRPDDLKIILDDSVAAIGWRYDVRNVVELAVYLSLVSLLPGRYRREALRFGSASAREVICTSLTGRLFHKVGFPVLPSVTQTEHDPRRGSLLRGFFRRRRDRHVGIYRRRHHTLLTPRDFDLSPYFEIVKFNVIEARGFDYTRIQWADEVEDELEEIAAAAVPEVEEGDQEA